ncbi:MAG: STAS domain-containing protein, partial [Chitinispirillaceae bacterium]|nr:STAS domain-containing protein [Chitinispirillaceae bacterium]
LDIIIEGRGDATWIILSGPFHKEQVPNIRGKFTTLLEDGNRYFIVNLEKLTAVDPAVVDLFLTIVNDIRAKGGELKLVFKNPVVSQAFAPYARLFMIYPDPAMLMSGGFFGTMLRRSRALTKKTGVRISLPVALFLVFVLCGWFLSLLFIITMQNQRISEQQKELYDLNQWKEHSTIELTTLRDRLRPLEQLGILRDTTRK